MLLYDGGRVPNARRVRMFLAEKGISVPMQSVDLGRKEHKSEAFSALNPLHRVPVLVLDDGEVLTESIAICRYFEELHPAPSLFGTTPRERARIEMWQRRIEFELYLPIAHVFRHTHPAMATFEMPQVPAWGEANRGKATDYMRQLDRDLARSAFIAGDAMSVADITAFIAMDFTKAGKVVVPDGLIHLDRWRSAIAARPSASA